MTINQVSPLENRLKIVSAVVVVIGLLFGIIQFGINQSIEAAQPYLERKLKWCEEATETAAAIAIRESGSELEKVQRFWELYWGVMGMVENDKVFDAMVAFGKGLNGKLPKDQTLRKLSLNIAHACRSEMSKDWSSIWSP